MDGANDAVLGAVDISVQLEALVHVVSVCIPRVSPMVILHCICICSNGDGDGDVFCVGGDDDDGDEDEDEEDEDEDEEDEDEDEDGEELVGLEYLQKQGIEVGGLFTHLLILILDFIL